MSIKNNSFFLTIDRLMPAVAVFFLFFLTLTYYHIFERAIFGHLSSDFPAHLKIVTHGSISSVHQLYHYSVRAYSWVTGLNSHNAATYTTLIYVFTSGLFIYLILNRYLKKILGWHWILFFTVTLFVVSAIWLPFIHSQIYLRIGTPNPMHNPTTFAVKPFAFAIFYLFIRMSELQENKLFVTAISASLLVIFSGYAKPNFNLALIFAAPLYIFYLSHNTKNIDIQRYTLMAIPIVSALTVLATQYLLKFETDQGGGIGFGLGNIASLNSVNPFIALFQLAAFPLVTIALLPKILKDRIFVFSLLLFLVAVIQYLFLYETGNRFNHGNFGWGRMIVAPLLFTATLGYFLRELLSKNSSILLWKLLALSLFYLMHLVSGVAYLFKLSFGSSYF